MLEESITMNMMRRLKSIASGRPSISSDPVSLTINIFLFFVFTSYKVLIFIIFGGSFIFCFFFWLLFGCWENEKKNVDEEINKHVH